VANIEERLSKLSDRLMEPEFMERRGLGNEIGFHIFDYDPEDETIVRDGISQIMERMDGKETLVQEFDLYEVMLDILRLEGVLEEALEIEEKEGWETFHEAIHSILNLDNDNNLMVNYIKDNLKEGSMVFLTGIGKVWPLVRSHEILNKLHSVVDDVPLVLFFPGTYTGQNFILFNEFDDENYYRAFKIVER